MRPGARSLKVFSTLLLPIALASCGGGGGGLPLLGGNLNVASFTIPAGQTQTVTSDLTVNSTGPILIAGTLLVPPGVNVNFLSPISVSVTGAITPATGKAQMVSHTSRGPGGAPVVQFNTLSGSISGNVTLPPGTSLSCARLAKPPARSTVTITGAITTGYGANSFTRGVDGGTGGSIEIGTAKAISDANSAFPTLPQGLTFAQPETVTVSGSLTAGNGGAGFYDFVGVFNGLTLQFEGSNGGNGGDCNIAADELALTGATISPGRGGVGGDGGDESHIKHAPDGKSSSAPGTDVVAKSGNGGNGGSITFTSPKVTGATGAGGLGADAGYISVSPGNGGPGGPGGNASVLVGAPGANGTGPNPPVGKRALAVVLIHTGGNGGASTTASVAGGFGGHATVSARAGGTAKGLVQSISLSGFGKGGAGYNGCSTLPPGAGTSGGNGGMLTVSGAGYSDTAFDGGTGGNGCGPGAGGKAGTDDANVKIGTDGTAGTVCANCPHASAFDAGSYYPLRTGDKYTYLYGFTGGTLSSDLTIGAATNIPGIAAPVVPETYFVGGVKSETAFVNSTSRAPIGVQQYGGDYYDQTGAIVQRVRYTPAWLIPQGLGLGQSKSQSITQVNSQPGNPDATQSYTLRTTLVSFEDITVPAGTYFGCAKVLTEFLSSTGTLFSSTNSWYAPSVGLVKNMDTVGDSQTLTAYVPAKSATR